MEFSRLRTRPPYFLPRLAALFLSCLVPAGASGQTKADVTPQVKELFGQAKAAQQEGDDATAIAKYRETIKLAPDLAAPYHNLGMLYFNAHDYVNAEEILKRGVALDPAMPAGAAMLGICYFQFGQNEKAETYLREALRIKPTDDDVEMILVNDLIKLNKYTEAAVLLNDFLARNPKNQEGWYLLGKAYMQMSDDALAKVNEIDSESVVAHEIAGEINENNHNYDNALLEYKKAIDMAPHQPGTHMHMANIYWLTGKWESAQLEFKAELANDPFNCTAHWKLGNAMLEATDSNEGALAQLDQALDRCPTLMQAHVDRARALIRMGKQADALPDLMSAEKANPSEPVVHFLLGSVYKAQGKTTEAQQEMRTYGKLQQEASDAIAAQANGIKAIKSAAH